MESPSVAFVSPFSAAAAVAAAALYVCFNCNTENHERDGHLTAASVEVNEDEDDYYYVYFVLMKTICPVRILICSRAHHQSRASCDAHTLWTKTNICDQFLWHSAGGLGAAAALPPTECVRCWQLLE